MRITGAPALLILEILEEKVIEAGILYEYEGMTVGFLAKPAIIGDNIDLHYDSATQDQRNAMAFYADINGQLPDLTEGYTFL